MQIEKIIIIEPRDVTSRLNSTGSYTNYYTDMSTMGKISKADLVLKIDEEGKATIIKSRSGGCNFSEDASMIPIVRYYEKKYGRKKKKEIDVDRFELMDLD